jgi:hypothetical protein
MASVPSGDLCPIQPERDIYEELYFALAPKNFGGEPTVSATILGAIQEVGAKKNESSPSANSVETALLGLMQSAEITEEVPLPRDYPMKRILGGIPPLPQKATAFKSYNIRGAYIVHIKSLDITWNVQNDFSIVPFNPNRPVVQIGFDRANNQIRIRRHHNPSTWEKRNIGLQDIFSVQIMEGAESTHHHPHHGKRYTPIHNTHRNDW